ncbi:MAG TPA: HPF/RaiA family ribosome-associated protein [Thermomicrobiales bacterium]|jgi:ribosome-associated translation inhibitor RaiA
MALTTQIHGGDARLGEQQNARIHRHLRRLERRLVHFPAPTAIMTLRRRPEPRQVTVDLRVELGPMAGELVSHQAAETPDHAVRLAVEDAERQLERRLATQRGEPTYGVPSRRLPRSHRPHPLSEGEEVG